MDKKIVLLFTLLLFSSLISAYNPTFNWSGFNFGCNKYEFYPPVNGKCIGICLANETLVSVFLCGATYPCDAMASSNTGDWWVHQSYYGWRQVVTPRPEPCSYGNCTFYVEYSNEGTGDCNCGYGELSELTNFPTYVFCPTPTLGNYTAKYLSDRYQFNITINYQYGWTTSCTFNLTASNGTSYSSFAVTFTNNSTTIEREYIYFPRQPAEAWLYCNYTAANSSPTSFVNQKLDLIYSSCDGSNNTLMGWAYDEWTGNRIYFDLFITNGTANLTTSDRWDFYEGDCNASLPVNDVTIVVSNDSYHPRAYTGWVGNATFEAYLVPLENTTIPVTFHVTSAAQPVEGATVTIKREVNNTWVEIASNLTDSNGNALFDLAYGIEHYVIASKAGYLPRAQLINITEVSYYLEMMKLSILDEWVKYAGKYTYSCSADNSSYPDNVTVNCSVNDTSGEMEYARLRIAKIGAFGSASVCDTNETLNATLNCTITSPANSTYTYALTAKFSYEHLLFQDTLDYSAAATLESYGVIPAMLLMLAMGMAVLWNPAYGILGATVGVIAASIMGLITLPITAAAGLVLAAIVIIYMLKV